MKSCEVCGYRFLLESSTKCPNCGDLREAIVADGYDFLTANSPANARTELQDAPKRPFELNPAPNSRSLLEPGETHPLTPLGSDAPLRVGPSHANASSPPNEDATQGLRLPFSKSVVDACVGLLAASRPSLALAQLNTLRSSPPEAGSFRSDLALGGLDCLQVAQQHVPPPNRALSTQHDEQLSFGHGQRHDIGRTDRPLEDVCRQEFGELSDGSGPRRSSHTLRSSPGSLPCGIVSRLDADATPFDQVATFPVTEEMLERGRYAGDPYLSDEELACKYRAMAAVAPNPRNVPYEEYDKLTRQLAAQALAHAEQMEEIRKDWAWSNSEWLETVEMKDARIAELKSQLAMRVTPATQPNDAQQTASDVKAAPERRPDGTLKPTAKAWEAPRRGSDPRRIGS